MISLDGCITRRSTRIGDAGMTERGVRCDRRLLFVPLVWL
jgi:hypothetical protein